MRVYINYNIFVPQYRCGLIGSTDIRSGNPLRKPPRFTVYTAAVCYETLINLITILSNVI